MQDDRIDIEFTDEQMEKALDLKLEQARAAVGDEDRFERLVQRLERKLKLLPYIGKQASDIACLVSLVRSYIKREYADIPIGTVVSIVSTLLYVVAPFDLIPDFAPIVGVADDIALLVWVMKSINSDVEEYRKWRVDNNRQIIDEL